MGPAVLAATCMAPTGTRAPIVSLLGSISTSLSGPSIPIHTCPWAAATGQGLGPTTKVCSTRPSGLTLRRPDTPTVTQTELFSKAMPFAPLPCALKTPRFGWCKGRDQITSPDRGLMAVREWSTLTAGDPEAPVPVGERERMGGQAVGAEHSSRTIVEARECAVDPARYPDGGTDGECGSRRILQRHDVDHPPCRWVDRRRREVGDCERGSRVAIAAQGKPCEDRADHRGDRGGDHGGYRGGGTPTVAPSFVAAWQAVRAAQEPLRPARQLSRPVPGGRASGRAEALPPRALVARGSARARVRRSADAGSCGTPRALRSADRHGRARP